MPQSTLYNEGAKDDYYNCLITKDHAAWIQEDAGSYELQIHRFVDSDNNIISTLDSQSFAVVDRGMFGWTENALRTVKMYRRDSGLLITVATGLADDVIWMDVDDELGQAYYLTDNSEIYAYSIDTGILRLVDGAAAVSLVGSEYQIKYADGVLVYHDATTGELRRYNPVTFQVRVIDTLAGIIKHLFCDQGFITWFDDDAQIMYLQERDDTTFEIVVLRDRS